MFKLTICFILQQVLFFTTFRKKILVLGAQTNQSLEAWTESLMARGRYAFALNEVREEFTRRTAMAVKSALKRLVDKGKILSVHKGYYLILPPQYAARGILPPSLFLDTFMRFLQRPYYVSLLNAAAYHGASHQQPQEFFVMTGFPVLRPTHKKGLKINYISIKDIPGSLLEQRKTEAGYLTISGAALTATDLVQYQNRIGGLSRAATVLAELAEVLTPASFTPELLAHAHTTSLQRLGYLLEYSCFQEPLAGALHRVMNQQGLNRLRTPLQASGGVRGYSSQNRWNVIVNTEIELDD